MKIPLLKTPVVPLILCSLWLTASLRAAEGKVTIRSDYPGGNIIEKDNQVGTVRLAPDLRDNEKDWFYWNFEAEAVQPGPVRFVFEGARVTQRGPAVSLDGGKTWKWLGAEAVTFFERGKNPDESFTYTFTKAGEKVRFSTGFPYVQTNLEEFLKKNASNPNLVKSVLTKSNDGRPVELLQIGKPGEGILPLLVGARNHACEALASYVLEGFLDEAMSDSAAGVAFRKKYVLYAVPFFDKDGVEKGDQGKNRAPHDHNRDYGDASIYPEVKAVQELAAKNGVRVAIDFHCPYLRGDAHEAYHWLGPRFPHVDNNINELDAWLAEERPLYANTAINFLAAPEKTPKTAFSFYFASKPDSLLGVTLESPYAQAETVDEARAYGRGLLRALVHTRLIGADSTDDRGEGAFKKFAEYRTNLDSLAKRSPGEAEARARESLDNPGTPSLYKAQADLAMAVVRQRAKQPQEAVEFARAALAEPGATASQKASALVLVTAILSGDTETTPEAMDKAVADVEAFSFAARSHRAEAYREAAKYYTEHQNFAKAIEYLHKRREFCANWEKSGTLLQEAAILDTMNKGAEAMERRKEVVALLKGQILPAPQGKSIFLGTMTGDYFDAIVALPSSTKEEKHEAANVVLNFSTLPQGLKERVEQWMSENQ